MLLVFVRVPLTGQFLVGAFDFEEGGVFRDAEDGIVVLMGVFGHGYTFNYSIIAYPTFI